MVLTALAVVLGVGFIAGTYVLTDTMNQAFDNLLEDAYAGIDVTVRGQSEFESDFGGSRKPFSEDLIDTVTGVDGVQAAAGSLEGYAQLIDRDGEAITPGGAPTLGFNWTPEELNPLNLRSGEPPAGPDEVVIDVRTAEDNDFAVGDTVEIITLRAPQEFTITGVAGFGDADNLAGATVAVFDTATSQELFDKQGQYDSIEVIAEEGVTPHELAGRIQEVLPPELAAETTTDVVEEQSTAIKDALGFFNTALLIFAGIALFVGAFIIFNTFSITVAQRTHEFALLRALGGSGRQVMTSVIVEALVVGAVASAIGLGVGILIALGLQALLSAFGIDLPTTQFQLLPRTIIASVSVGMIVTVISSVMPARRAARTSPMAALRESMPQTYRPSRRRIITGALVTIAGIATLLTGLFGDPGQPAAVVGLGAAIIFFGVTALNPVFAGPLARALGIPGERLFKVPGRLARQNAARNPKRTAATASALMIGLALVGFVGIFGASLKASVNKIFEESMKAEFAIQPSSFAGFAISPDLVNQLEASDQLGTVAAFRLGEFRRNETSEFVTGVDPAALEEVADIEVIEGDLNDLEDGGVFLYSNTAEDLGVSVGDTVEMKFAATGDQELTVQGIYDNNSLVGTNYVISGETYAEHFTEATVTNILVGAGGTMSAEEARSAIESVAQTFPNVEVLDQNEAQETAAEQIDQLLNLITALLGLALLIALLGITNTLALSVFERTRELGLLRAVGMSRRQTRKMIRWEAVIISIIGALVGLVIGTFFGWALVQALESEGITEFSIPGGQLLLYLVLAGLAGVLAAIPPARRAARLNVLEAIATE
ncbi:MAG TPA: FtsX-like permease family protein [Actinomycetota bacterium]|nr:FtsX-like permease family protein [Actinomycetota bacterium]